ncbi:MAG: helix-turn-helix domain-containing protein [Halapricum sp.]
MVRASLTLTVPDDIWIRHVSRTFPEARFRVRSARSCDGLGIGLVEIVADDVEAIVEATERADDVDAVQPLQGDEQRVLVQVEASNPRLVSILDRTGVPIEMPFDIRNGAVESTLTTTRDRLSALGSALDRSPFAFDVDHVWDSAQFGHVLTDRQQEVLGAAVEQGYYDSPRQCTQEELAADLDMAKSTCSEILHRAEERIIKRFDEVHTDSTRVRQPA